MKKLKPIEFSPEERQAVVSQTKGQERMQGTPKSSDPANFPVWSVPVGKKVLIYVPNHVEVNSSGEEEMRMDVLLSHSLTLPGKRYRNFRCTYGIVNERAGLDGSCPFCEAVPEPWDLANTLIKNKCIAQGLDPEDTENETVKALRSAIYGDRVLKDADKKFIFPIVVFETLNDDGKTLIKDGNSYKYKVYWYVISEKLYEEKWSKCFEGMEDEPSHPAGRFFLLNYIYKPKNGKQQNQRDAARNLVVSARNIQNSEKLRAYLDKETEDWTPAKAQKTVYEAMWYPLEDLRDVADEVLAPTRTLIEFYENSESDSAGAIETSGANAGGFTLSKPAENNDNSGEEPPIMEGLDIEAE